jgi:hypothetical protein
MLLGLQTNPGLRQCFEGMLVARQEVLTQSLDLSGGPEGHICHVANLAKDNQPWPSACALHLHPSGRAESICQYSEVP